jgi:NAD(P)-dependent dehydrogenase (short-subunit alcohol dehydrogenase family)
MESGKLGYGVRVNCIYPGLVPTEMGAQWRRTWSRSGCGRTPTPSSVTSSA